MPNYLSEAFKGLVEWIGFTIGEQRDLQKGLQESNARNQRMSFERQDLSNHNRELSLHNQKLYNDNQQLNDEIQRLRKEIADLKGPHL